MQEYWDNDVLKFEGEYINGKKMEKEKIMILMEIYYLKANIYMDLY